MSFALAFFLGWAAAWVVFASVVFLVPVKDYPLKDDDVKKPSYFDRDHG